MTQEQTTEQLRERLAKGFDEATVTEAVNRFGGEDREIRLKAPFNWNHRIDSFFIATGDTVKGRLCAGIYWQGDSTDGNDSVLIDEIARRGRYVIPAKTFFDGERTRTTHSDIVVEKDELDAAAKALAQWLSPEAFAEREEQRKKYEFRKRVGVCTDALYKEFIRNRWDRDERWYNGYAAVNKCSELHYEELKDRSDNELAAILRKVFLANRDYDRNLPKTADGIAYRLDI